MTKEKNIAAEKQAAVEKQRALDMTRAGRFGAGDVRSGESMTSATYPMASPQRKAGPPPPGCFGGRGAGDVPESGAAAGAGSVGHHSISSTVSGLGARGGFKILHAACPRGQRGDCFDTSEGGRAHDNSHHIYLSLTSSSLHCRDVAICRVLACPEANRDMPQRL